VTYPMLEAALAYARRGLPVFPLWPGKKIPRIGERDGGRGFHDATLDEAQIREWWTRWPDANIGVAVPAHLIVLDVDPRKGGDVTWKELAGDRTVDTLTSFSGRGDGGFHLYLLRPEGDIKGNPGPGVDIKVGGAGYVVAPPSIHPDSGKPYTWGEAGPDAEFQAPPDWLTAWIVRPEAPAAPVNAVPPRPAGGGFEAEDDGPAGDYNRKTTWHEILPADGWTIARVIGEEVRWVRPGKNARDGISATTGHQGRDCLKVFTSSVPGLEPDEAYSRFGYYAAIHHGGDRSAAARELRRLGYGGASEPFDPVGWITEPARQKLAETAGEDPEAPAPDSHGWETVDLGGVLDEGYEPPKPELLRRTDGKALLYRGRINGLFGESGGGKSFISQRAIVEVIAAHGNVLVIDLEDHVGSYIARLMAMGLTRQAIRGHLRYISPELALGPQAGVYLAELVTDFKPELVVIDSTGEALSIQGVRPNEDDEVARWFRTLPRAIANLGPAVLTLDHVPKSDDAPKNYAIGSQRKRAAIDGALYRVEVGVAPVKGKTGRLKLICAKDRAGNWQHGTQVAEVTIADTADGTQLTLSEPSDPNRPTTLMIKVSEFLDRTGRVASRRQIDQNVSGKREYVARAIDALIGEGYCREKQREGKGGGVDIELVRPFNDPVDFSWIDGSASSAPTASHAIERGSLTPAEPFCVFCVPQSIGHGTRDTEGVGQGASGAPFEPPNRVPTENAVSAPDDEGGESPAEHYVALPPEPERTVDGLF